MYNLFKTTFSIHHPLEFLIRNQSSISDFFKHPIDTGIYESKICPFGNFASILIILWLWIRLLFNNTNLMLKLNKILFIIISITSFAMNINSFVYLIPIYLYEFFFLPKLILQKSKRL